MPLANDRQGADGDLRLSGEPRLRPFPQAPHRLDRLTPPRGNPVSLTMVRAPPCPASYPTLPMDATLLAIVGVIPVPTLHFPGRLEGAFPP